MNRAQLRAQVKNGDLYTEAQVREICRDVTDRYTKQITRYYMAVTALALRDKLGFGSKRTKDFLDHLEGIMTSVANRDITADDIHKTLEEEIGVRIE